MSLCECGCGQETKIIKETSRRQNRKAGDHYRFVHGHNARSSPVDYIEEDRGFTTRCWIWQLANDGQYGYGRVHRGGKRSHAHRWYYEKFKGKIPDKLHLDHLCRVPPCVNPDHLEPVTHVVNSRRGIAVKLDVKTVLEIRSRLKNGKRGDQRRLAREYGVSESLISQVKLGRIWK